MKFLLPVSFLLFLIMLTSSLRAQKIDSIFFNLYTDSLKKNTYNYINVDGKSGTNWLPLTAKQLKFTATGGKFDGNSLFIDKDYKEDKVTVTALLISDSTIHKSVTIYVKKNEDNEKLKTAEEIKREIEEAGKPRKRNLPSRGS